MPAFSFLRSSVRSVSQVRTLSAGSRVGPGRLSRCVSRCENRLTVRGASGARISGADPEAVRARVFRSDIWNDRPVRQPGIVAQGVHFGRHGGFRTRREATCRRVGQEQFRRRSQCTRRIELPLPPARQRQRRTTDKRALPEADRHLWQPCRASRVAPAAAPEPGAGPPVPRPGSAAHRIRTGRAAARSVARKDRPAVMNGHVCPPCRSARRRRSDQWENRPQSLAGSCLSPLSGFPAPGFPAPGFPAHETPFSAVPAGRWFSPLAPSEFGMAAKASRSYQISMD